MTTGQDYAEDRLAMLTALVNGDVPLAHRVALGLLGDGVPFDDIAVDVLGPVQSELGRRWAAGDLGIAHEHAASSAVEDLLIRLGAVAESPRGPGIVVASSEHDAHSLGARLVASALALEGYRVMFLGASVPPHDLTEFLEMQDPLALALSCSIPTALAAAARSVAAAHELGIPVVGGGSALKTDARATVLGFDGRASSPRQAVEILRRWEHAVPDPLGRAPSVRPGWESLMTFGPELAAAAMQAHPVGAIPGMALHAELFRVLQVLESALTVADPTIAAQHVEWLRSTGPAHGFALVDIDAVLSALATVLATPLPDGAELLRDALG